MVLPVWPSTLPTSPLLADFKIPELFQQPLATGMEDGPDRLRKTQTVRITKQQVGFLLTTAQLGTLDTFLYTTLANASSWFTMKVMKPSGMITKDCQVVPGSISIDPVENKWKVVFTLNVRDW